MVFKLLFVIIWALPAARAIRYKSSSRRRVGTPGFPLLSLTRAGGDKVRTFQIQLPSYFSIFHLQGGIK